MKNLLSTLIISASMIVTCEAQTRPGRPGPAGQHPTRPVNNQRTAPGVRQSGDNIPKGNRQPELNSNSKQTQDINNNNKFDNNGGRNPVNNQNNYRPTNNNRQVGNNINSGNRGDVNININNSHNTYVRANSRPYSRPPHVYGGYHYSCYHPYVYHPYRPYYWGPVYHPWGFFITTLAVTAVVVEINNQKYHYDQGVFYAPSNGGYTVIQAPTGATVTTIPSNSQTIVINETTNNYYYGGTYYEKSNTGYTVVPPVAGTIVENLPESTEEVKMGDVTYMKAGDNYYQPTQQNGKDMYEVVMVQPTEEQK